MVEAIEDIGQVSSDRPRDRFTLTVVVAAAVLVAIALAAPRIARANLPEPAVRSDGATEAVALHGVTVPDRSGGDLECRSTTGFASNERQWDCGETRVTAKYGQTTDDPSLALARFVRYRLLEREPDTSAIEDLGGDARVARVERPEGALVTVAVPSGNGSVYVEFAKGDAEAAAQPLIDAVRGGEFDDEQ